MHETWRRHGLGEALLRLAFRTFQAGGASGVELKVQAQNASAIRLYERVGMRTSSGSSTVAPRKLTERVRQVPARPSGSILTRVRFDSAR